MTAPEPSQWAGFESGNWTAVCQVETGIRGEKRIKVRCICGTERVVAANELLRGSSKSCGCMKGARVAMSKAGRPLATGAAPTAEDATVAAGVILDGIIVKPSDVQVFRESVLEATATGCRPWGGPPNRGGYGRATVGGHRILAHRLAYALATRRDPTGLVVRHKCNNRICVNHEHLLIGTQVDNVRDAVEAGRMASGEAHGLRMHPERRATGENHGSSKLTLAQVEAMRAENPLPIPYGMLIKLARKYGVTYGVIKKVLHGTAWVTPPQSGGPMRKQTPRSKLGPAWESLKAFYGFACLRCYRKEPDVELTADHVIPTTKGGLHDISNIQPLCQSCNSHKGGRVIDYRPGAAKMDGAA